MMKTVIYYHRRYDEYQPVEVNMNKHANLMFWHIGHFINEDLGYRKYSAYGDKIIATLSQRLTNHPSRRMIPSWFVVSDLQSDTYYYQDL